MSNMPHDASLGGGAKGGGLLRDARLQASNLPDRIARDSVDTRSVEGTSHSGDTVAAWKPSTFWLLWNGATVNDAMSTAAGKVESGNRRSDADLQETFVRRSDSASRNFGAERSRTGLRPAGSAAPGKPASPSVNANRGMEIPSHNPERMRGRGSSQPASASSERGRVDSGNRDDRPMDVTRIASAPGSKHGDDTEVSETRDPKSVNTGSKSVNTGSAMQDAPAEQRIREDASLPPEKTSEATPNPGPRSGLDPHAPQTSAASASEELPQVVTTRQQQPAGSGQSKARPGLPDGPNSSPDAVGSLLDGAAVSLIANGDGSVTQPAPAVAEAGSTRMTAEGQASAAHAGTSQLPHRGTLVPPAASPESAHGLDLTLRAETKAGGTAERTNPASLGDQKSPVQGQSSAQQSQLPAHQHQLSVQRSQPTAVPDGFVKNPGVTGVVAASPSATSRATSGLLDTTSTPTPMGPDPSAALPQAGQALTRAVEYLRADTLAAGEPGSSRQNAHARASNSMQTVGGQRGVDGGSVVPAVGGMAEEATMASRHGRDGAGQGQGQESAALMAALVRSTPGVGTGPVSIGMSGGTVSIGTDAGGAGQGSESVASAVPAISPLTLHAAPGARQGSSIPDPRTAGHVAESQAGLNPMSSTAARSLLVRLPAEHRGEAVQLRFLQRGDQIDVRVTSASEATAQELREQLPTLVGRLQQAGIATERAVTVQPNGEAQDLGRRVYSPGQGEPNQRDSQDGPPQQRQQQGEAESKFTGRRPQSGHRFAGLMDTSSIAIANTLPSLQIQEGHPVPARKNS